MIQVLRNLRREPFEALLTYRATNIKRIATSSQLLWGRALSACDDLDWLQDPKLRRQRLSLRDRRAHQHKSLSILPYSV